MEFNSAGLNLIKEFEGCKLTSYLDQKGIWTIGYGCTHHVTIGMLITQNEADARLADDVKETVNQVKHCLGSRNLNDNQFSACVSLAYNIGVGNFKLSTLLHCLLMNNTNDAAQEFLKWVKVNTVPDQGLINRRTKEQELFLTPTS